MKRALSLLLVLAMVLSMMTCMVVVNAEAQTVNGKLEIYYKYTGQTDAEKQHYTKDNVTFTSEDGGNSYSFTFNPFEVIDAQDKSAYTIRSAEITEYGYTGPTHPNEEYAEKDSSYFSKLTVADDTSPDEWDKRSGTVSGLIEDQTTYTLGSVTVYVEFAKVTEITNSIYFGQYNDTEAAAKAAGDTRNLQRKAKEGYTLPDGDVIPGYTFKGWTTTEKGFQDLESEYDLKVTTEAIKAYVAAGTTVYSPSNERDVVWYPVYFANQYQVKYDLNDGTYPEAAQYAYYYYDDSVAYIPVAVSAEYPNGYMPLAVEEHVLVEPSRTGYTFQGWAGDDGVVMIGNVLNTKYIPADGKTLTLTAQWKAIKYNVQEWPGDGSGKALGTYEGEYDKAYEVTNSDIERTGYTLNGWKTVDKTKDAAKNSEDVYVFPNNTAESNLTATEDATVNVTAVWDVNEYTVTLDAQGGTIAQASLSNTGFEAVKDAEGEVIPGLYNKKHNYDVAVSFPKNGNNITREGYTFAGWYVMENGEYVGTNPITGVAANYTVADNLTYYAKWTYNLTLNAGAGELSEEDQSALGLTPKKLGAAQLYTGTFVDDGNAVVLPTEPTNTSADAVQYLFMGWYTDENGQGEKVEEITSEIVTKYAKDGTLGLYAYWLGVEYTVTLNTMGGTLEDSKNVVGYNFGQNVVLGDGTKVDFNTNGNYNILKNAVPTRYGYTFKGWYTADGTVDSNADNWQEEIDWAKLKNVISNSDAGNIELYARWEANEYYINVICEGNTITKAYTIESEDTIRSLFDGEVIKDYKNLAQLEADGYVPEYTLTNVADADADASKAAVFRDETGKVIADGWGQPSADNIYYGDESLAGHFGYVEFTINSWSKEYTIEYHLSGAEFTTTAYPVSYEFNSKATTAAGEKVSPKDLPLPAVERTGYTFDGWFYDAECVEELTNSKIDHSRVYLNGVMDIYAKWIAHEYTIAFDANGGDDVAPIAAVYDYAEYDEDGALISEGYALPTPTKDHYDFVAWEDENGTLYKAGQYVQNLTAEDGATVTLTAIWTPTKYDVTYVVEGCEDDTKTYTIEDGAIYTPTAPEGKMFIRWNVTAAAASGNWNIGTTATSFKGKYGDITLTAEFKEITYYTITFDPGTASYTGAAPTQTVIGGQATTLNDCKFTAPAGYVFDHWEYTDPATGKTVSVKDGGKVTVTSSVTLTAKWVEAATISVAGANLSLTDKTSNTLTSGTAYSGTLVAAKGYTLPLGIKVTVDGKALDGDSYTYNYATGALTIAKSVITDSVKKIVVTAAAGEEPSSKDDVFAVELDMDEVEVTSGDAYAYCDGKTKYVLTFQAIGTAELPEEVSIVLMQYEKNKAKAEEIETLIEGEDYEYDSKDGEIVISKTALEDLYDEYYDKDYTTYILISCDATTNGTVTYVSKTEAGKTVTALTTMSFDEAIAQLEDDADLSKNPAATATITLKGDVTTAKQIVVPEGVSLKIAGKYDLTSTYTNKTASKNNAIVLEKDTELELDVEVFGYAAANGVYDKAESADVTADYGTKLVCSNKSGTVVGSYLVSDAAAAVTLASEQMNAKGSKVTAAEISVAKTETLTDKVSKKVEDGMKFVLADGVSLTATVKLADVEAASSGKNITTTEKSGSYTYAVTEPKVEVVEKEEEPVVAPVVESNNVTVNVTASAGGTVSPSSTEVAKGSKVSIVVTPDSGYSVGTVKINGTTFQSGVIENGILSWTVSKDTTIVISFVQASFSDVPSTAWYAPYVSDVVAQGLMVGYADGTFGAEKNMTVAEYLTVMYRYLKDMLPDAVAAKNTTGTGWTEAAEYVNDAVFNGLYTDRLTANVTRYDVAHITSTVLQTVSRLTGKSYANRAALTFSDVPSSDTYYSDVTYLSTVNIIDGYLVGSTRTFKGANNISRAEIAKVLSCLIALG